MSNPSAEIRRPTPEAFLKLAQSEEAANADRQRGRLKIFLGYAAGVGKTYAMLEAAWNRKLDGRDVVVAYVESHGRFETDSLLSGLKILPRKMLVYNGVTLPEMDLDAVLARRPQIALVDELAHSNVPGSRHEKRWQDVEELLDAGIDVYTTVNIQHLESLVDVVEKVTGIRVRETVPDRLLDAAFEIRLVDIPPEDLLERLREGKVYVPEQAAWATERFFKPGNLMALRELSLRCTAARVDEQMRSYMESRLIDGPWQTAERLLVCISGSPYSEQLIRSTRRLADELKAEWLTVYIETVSQQKEIRENRGRIWKYLRLAESLGAKTSTLTATEVAEAVIDFANRHNITRIVVGKPSRPRWRELLRPPVVDQIIRKSGSIDIVVVSLGTPAATGPPGQSRDLAPLSSYAASLALVAGASLLSELCRPFLAPPNMVMIYLLAVVLAALRLGRRPAIMAAFFGVLAFDFFFVPPRFSFSVTDTEYLLTFIGLFVVGAVISTLVARTRERAEMIREREAQTASLYSLSRDLAAAADLESLLQAVIRNVETALDARLLLLLPEGESLSVVAASTGLGLDAKEHAVADWAFRNQKPAGCGTETLASSTFIFLPLQTPGSILGVLGARLRDAGDYRSTTSRRLLEAFATQTAMAIERVQLSRQAEQVQIMQARESFERALLNSISHDLRTPLASIHGVLSTLRDSDIALSETARQELIETASAEAGRLNHFIGNLLDLTRLEAGALHPRLTLCDVHDLVGCALSATEGRLCDRPVQIDIPVDLPPVAMDLVLMTQVLVNLIENICKYAPPASPVEIAAQLTGNALRLTVSDRGHGVPEEDLQRIFHKFYRLPVPEGAGGTGLGLSICKGIVEAHRGSIHAKNRATGGLQVTIVLPVQDTNEEEP